MRKYIGRLVIQHINIISMNIKYAIVVKAYRVKVKPKTIFLFIIVITMGEKTEKKVHWQLFAKHTKI